MQVISSESNIGSTTGSGGTVQCGAPAAVCDVAADLGHFGFWKVTPTPTPYHFFVDHLSGERVKVSSYVRRFLDLAGSYVRAFGFTECFVDMLNAEVSL